MQCKGNKKGTGGLWERALALGALAASAASSLLAWIPFEVLYSVYSNYRTCSECETVDPPKEVIDVPE